MRLSPRALPGRGRSIIPSLAAVLALGVLAGCGGAPPPAAVSSDLQQARPRVKAPAATVVLIHGMAGWKQVLGVDYFWGVPEAYRGAGASVVVASTAALQSIEVRAAQLKAQLDAVEPRGGPLVLVAHSQGGLDARWLITKLGYAPRVKALITIAAPHHGSQLADVATGLLPGAAYEAADVLLNTIGWSLDEVAEVTTASMLRFNRDVPDADGVTYWSYSGRAAPLGFGAGNGWLQSELLPSWTVLDAMGIASDGIVPEASAHWGRFLGAVPASHFGEVGQIFGVTPKFDHAAFYTDLLTKMHDEGW